MRDTILTLEDQQQELVEVKDLQVTRHTIGLVRDTKQLTISLHQTANDFIGEIAAEESKAIAAVGDKEVANNSLSRLSA